MWDQSKRSLLVLQRLGYKLNPIAVLNRELHNKRLVGLLTKEEERELREKRAREVSIYMAKEAGIPLSEEDLQFDREQELYDENSSTHELDEHEVKAGETWDSQRFAWLLEMHERYEQNLVTLLYEGKLTPPEQAAIDYKLPKQRPLSDNS